MNDLSGMRARAQTQHQPTKANDEPNSKTCNPSTTKPNKAFKAPLNLNFEEMSLRSTNNMKCSDGCGNAGMLSCEPQTIHHRHSLTPLTHSVEDATHVLQAAVWEKGEHVVDQHHPLQRVRREQIQQRKHLQCATGSGWRFG